MCDACERPAPPTPLSRRRLLRGVLGAAAAAATGPLWLPGLAGTSFAEDGGGEDASTAGTSRGGGTAIGQRPDGVVTTRTVPAPNLGGVTPPPIISRAAWGADESLRLPMRAFAPVRKIVVHHSASPNRPANPAAVVRSIYEESVGHRGFADLAYNFLIDHKGAIYEGRYSRRYGDEPVTGEDHAGWGVIGAHSKTMNAGSCGICLVGNFDEGSPTDAALMSLQWLIAWKANRQRIDVRGEDPFVNVYGSWSRFGNLSGHRNVGSTACPGKNLYAWLPQLRRGASAQAGSWDPIVVEIPRAIRYDWSPYGQGPLAPSASTAAPPAPPAASNAPASAGAAPAAAPAAGSGPSATVATAYRAVTDSGQVFTVGKANKLGQPGASSGHIVAMAGPGWGDGFVTLTASGAIATFGQLRHIGDVAAKGDGAAVDVAVSATGAGYWILMANGGIYPFGDAKYFSSPKRAGLTAIPVRIEPRPQQNGYWVLFADGTVRGFGGAPSLGGPGTGSGAPVDIASTASGAGYWVLLDTGEVAAFGDAPAKGGMGNKNARWAKPAVAITRVGADGYVISARDGGLATFNGAPYLGSFAGSGARVVGIATAAI